jgi:hypothetical protein
MRLTWVIVVCFCALVAACLQERANAQTATGSMLGTVTDASGAVVPGAAVEVLNEDTGFKRSMATDTSGGYEFLALQPGRYTVRVVAQGFRTFATKDLTVAVEQRARVDIQLVVGATSETLSVTEQAPIINTEDASLGHVIEQAQVIKLPLNGRSFMELTTLVPGVNTGAPSDYRAYVHAYAPSANGARPEFNSYYMDGTDNNDAFAFTFNVTPSIDSIEEFKVQTGMFSAEFGRAAGAVVNLVTRSGSNAFHGSVFEFFRNDKLDARDFFAPSTQPKAPYRRNQYGFSAGGPIVHNKLFFFGNYEGTKIRQSSTSIATIPTDAERTGNLSAVGPIYDPATTAPNPSNPSQYTRAQFPNNQIPTSRIDSISAKMLAYWPEPNAAGAVRNYVQNLPAKTDTNRWIGRVDYNLSSKDRVFGRYAYDHNPRYVPGALPSAGGIDYPDANQGLTVDWSRTVSPRVLNEAKLGYNRMRWGYFPQNAGNAIAAQLGLTGIATSPAYALSFPRLSIAGFNAPSDIIPFFFVDNHFQYADTLSWERANHTLKFGFSAGRTQTNTIGYGPLQGLYSFTNRFTNSPLSSSGGTAFADFLLGDLTSVQQLRSAPLQYYRSWDYSAFATDDWKVTSRLTLTLGLRYENQRPFTEKYDRMVSYNPLTRQLVFPRGAPIGNFFQSVRPDLPIALRDQSSDYNADNHNFAPRFGFAYRPFSGNATVIRGGFGIFYSGWMTDIFENTGTAPPFVAREIYTADVLSPNLGWNYRGVAFALTPYSLYMMDDRNVVNPYVEQWSLNIQHSFTSSMVLEIGYFGNHGLKLTGVNQINAAPTSSTAPLQPRRFDPNYGSIISWNSMYNSWHQSMTVSVKKQYANGLEFLTGYTYGKTLDETSTANATVFERYASGPGKFDRGPADFDLRHQFVGSFIYALPFGKGGKALTSVHGVPGALISGWSVNGIVTVRSGFHSTVGLAQDNLNSGLSSYPNEVANPNAVSNQSIYNWWNQAAFVIPPFGVQGNAGRNTLLGPGLRTANLSAVKIVPIREGKERFEFRGEFYNALNHPNFSQPNATLGTPQFGQIFGTAITMREIQLAAKLYF